MIQWRLTLSFTIVVTYFCGVTVSITTHSNIITRRVDVWNIAISCGSMVVYVCILTFNCYIMLGTQSSGFVPLMEHWTDSCCTLPKMLIHPMFVTSVYIDTCSMLSIVVRIEKSYDFSILSMHLLEFVIGPSNSLQCDKVSSTEINSLSMKVLFWLFLFFEHNVLLYCLWIGPMLQ